MADAIDRVAVLERRLGRERRARADAERIAERTTRDLYDRKEELAMLAAAGACANRARTPEQALAEVLPLVCRHLSWSMAQAWLYDELAGDLRHAHVSHVGDGEHLTAFVDDSTERRFAIGEGLPGRVLERGEPAWIFELRDDPNFPRAAVAQVAGLVAAVGLPVIVGGDVVAVLECFSSHLRRPTEDERRVVGAVGEMLSQVFERRRHEQRVRHDSEHDRLTGLPNRGLLCGRLADILGTSDRRARGLAVVAIDLQRFREVNEALGHQHGDELLVEVGKRLRSVLGEHDMVARISGDEFALLACGIETESDRLALTERVTRALREPIRIAGVPLGVDVRLGLALHPEHGDEGDELLRRADLALRQAKRRHVAHAVYAPHLDTSDPQRLRVVAELRAAIDGGQLELHFQPKIELTGRRVVGVEALVRWPHPDRGLLAPGAFIPLAERTGLIGPLTSHVLREALQQARRWLDEDLEVPVAINVSPRTLLDPGFVAEIREMLLRADLPPRLVELEITESSMLESPVRTGEVLAELTALGLSFSIDDFGTGYSSLVQLKQLPVDRLKIDRSFVGGMTRDERDAFIVRGAIHLGHDLGLSIVAEGVENEATLSLLEELGCDVAQGYLIQRPAPAETLHAWLRAHLAGHGSSRRPAPPG